MTSSFRWITLLSVLLVAASSSTLARADEQTRAYVQRSERLTALLDKIDGFLRVQDWSSAVDQILEAEELLAVGVGRDASVRFVHPASAVDLFVGVEVAVATRLGRLPPEGIAQYRQSVDPRAQEFLIRSASSSRRLELVAARYPLSSHGVNALEKLALRAFEAGDFESAARLLDGLARLPESLVAGTGVDLDRLTARRFAARLLSGDVGGSRSLARDLEAVEGADAPPRIALGGGEALPPGEWLQKLGPAASASQDQTFQTARRRRFISVAGGDLGLPLVARYTRSGELPPLPSVPVADGDEVVVCDTRSVSIFDVRTGQVRLHSERRLPGSQAVALENLSAQAAIAGDLVVIAVNLGLPPVREAVANPDAKEGEETEVLKPRENHRLVAVHRRTGKVVWDTGEGADGGAALAREAVALSPPLILGDRVFVTATVSKSDLQAHLVAFDLHTGALVFRTFLCSRSPHNYLGLAAGAAVPVMSEGLVIAATNLGVVAAIDPAEGRFVWAWRYGPYPQRAQADYVEASRRFALEPPLVEGGDLFVAPRDGNWLVALNAATGSVMWRFPRDRVRRLVGLTPDRVLVAGDRLLALDRRSGLVLGRSEPLGGGGVQARAVVSGQVALVPTKEAIVEVDVDDLSISGRYVFERPERELGHLVLTGGSRPYLVSGGPAGLTVFERLEEPLGGQTRYSAPGELRRGEVAVRRGAEREAVERLERALASGQLGPARSDLARQLLVEAAVRQVRAASAAGDVEPLQVAAQRVFANRPKDSAALVARRLLGEALIVAGDGVGAVEQFQAILDGSFAEIVTLPSGASVRATAYARARLEHVVARFGRQAYARQDEIAADLVAVAQRTGTKTGYEDVLRRYPVSHWARQARLLLAEHYEEKGLVSAAAQLFEEHLADHGDEDEGRALVLIRLVEAYEAMRRMAAARRVLDELVDRHPEAQVVHRGQQLAVVDFVRGRLGQPEYLRAFGAEDSVASLPMPLQRLWRTGTDLLGANSEVVLPARRSPRDSVVLLRRGKDLEARTLDSGILLWRRAEVGRLGRRRRPGYSESFLFLPDPDGITALDPRSGIQHFRVEPAPPVEGERRRGAAPGAAPDVLTAARIGPDAVLTVGYTADRVLVLTGWNELLCIEAATGDVLWRRLFEERLGSELLVRGGYAIVATMKPGRLNGIDLMTGARAWVTGFGEERRLDITGRPVLGSTGTVFVVLGGRRVACVDSVSGNVRWERALPYWVEEVRPVPGVDCVLAVAPPASVQAPFAVLRTADGRALWQAEPVTRGRMERVFVGPERIYAVHSQGTEFQLVAYELRTGKRLWEWNAPAGQAALDLFETPDHLLLPRTVADGSAAVCVVGKTKGLLESVLKVPGRRLHSAAVVGEVFVLLTDRGDFGLGRVDPQNTWAEVVEIAAELARRPGDATLRALLADRYFKLGELHRSVAVLEEGILREDVQTQVYALLYEQLAGIKEAIAEAEQVVIEVPRLSRPPEIDGELNDTWERWASVGLQGPGRVSLIQRDPGEGPGLWHGDEDLSGRVYFGYDERALYFAVDIRDLDLRPYDGEADTWVGDCLLIALDPRNDGGYWFARDDTLLSLALTLPRKQKPGEEGEDEGKPEGRYFVKRKDDGSGAVYEAEIPWTVLARNGADVPPPERLSGFTFGFNLVVTDDDGSRSREGVEMGATKYLTITPGILLHHRKDRLWQGFIPEHFPRITLR